mmetsp:Transcript_96458/g.201529  ORF Transcript_96458/g.201529 Transcript_96458/m.201529 type:complete len:208 (-) Transcript_96458:1734-2357(-)
MQREVQGRACSFFCVEVPARPLLRNMYSRLPKNLRQEMSQSHGHHHEAGTKNKQRRSDECTSTITTWRARKAQATDRGRAARRLARLSSRRQGGGEVCPTLLFLHVAGRRNSVEGCRRSSDGIRAVWGKTAPAALSGSSASGASRSSGGGSGSSGSSRGLQRAAERQERSSRRGSTGSRFFPPPSPPRRHNAGCLDEKQGRRPHRRG